MTEQILALARTLGPAGVTETEALEPLCRAARAELEGMLLGRIRAADQRLEQRRERPFSREELAVLFAAMLMEE